MRLAILLLAVGTLALGGCDSAHVQDCEKQLLEKLKAPSTYQRIGVHQITLNAGEPPHYHLIEIEYDAQNSYGALLRDKEACRYRLDDKGRPTMELYDPYENLTDTTEIDTAVDDALEAAANAVENADAAIEAAETVADEEDYSAEYHEEYGAGDIGASNANEETPANVAE